VICYDITSTLVNEKICILVLFNGKVTVSIAFSHFPDRESFLNTSKWIDDVRMERGNEVVLMLCGNKNDSAEQRYWFAVVLPISHIELSHTKRAR